MQDEILIGEGVVIDARPAGFMSRAAGILIDVVVLYVTAAVMLGVTTAITGGLDQAAQAAAMVTIGATVLVGIPTAVETLTRGRSLGKLAAGIRIVRDDGGPVRFRHAVIRALTGLLELWLTLGSVALVTSILNSKGKRLGDLLAGTYALRVRGGQRPMPPMAMPHELAAWARTTDIRRLPDGLALSARQFLGRSGTLHMESRIRLGVALAGELEQYVAPGPPPGTHPERFIAAVLTERRDREYAIAVRQARAAADEAVLLHRLPHAVPDPAD